MSILLGIWLMLAAALVGVIIRRGECGGVFLLTYFVGLSLIHLPGAFIYLGSAQILMDHDITLLGFQATILGLVALLLGAWVGRVRPLAAVRFNPVTDLAYLLLGKKILLLGLGVYFILMPVLSFIPSAASVLSAGGSLLPLAFWCWLYGSRTTKYRKRFYIALALIPIFPVLTMVSGGFIGYGVYWMLTVAAFVYWLSLQKKWYILFSPLVVMIGLSFSVAYFGERNSLRDVVWIEKANFGARIERVSEMFVNFELIDINDSDHVRPINDRLNQNILVGMAIKRHQDNMIDLSYGATVPIWILIPRAIWPDKPSVGGSGNIVSDATGLVFSKNTSVGVGQTLEFYINFGWVGIVFGFAIFGYLLMRFDMALTQAFQFGDIRAILFVGLPGISLMQPGGSLMEIIVSFIGAYVAAYMVHQYLKKLGLLHLGSIRSLGRSA